MLENKRSTKFETLKSRSVGKLCHLSLFTRQAHTHTPQVDLHLQLMELVDVYDDVYPVGFSYSS